ncbi:MAG: ribosome silencing factor [Candidatus Kryptoniota bacterium]
MAERKTLQHRIAELALTKKAKDVAILDLRKLTSMTDYFVVCTGDSETQVKAIADAILAGMEEHGERAWHAEGLQNLQWVLLDFVDVVVHVFHKDARTFYGLEKLWGDARIQKVADRKPKALAPKPRRPQTERK